MLVPIVALALLSCVTANGAEPAQEETISTDLVRVISRPLEKTTVFPGELKPFQSVDVHARITGFVREMRVDRGSEVTEGQVLAVIEAPELELQSVEARSRIPPVDAQRVEAAARLAAAESTFERLTEAARTPGVVAGNDVVLAEKAVEAERAHIESLDRMIASYEASARAIEEIERYLQVTAPFSGVITERFAHIGSLVGPDGSSGTPLFTIEQLNPLRLEVGVPEADTESVRPGLAIRFSVPAYPDETFTGAVRRIAHAVDAGTRTMPVEADVSNPGGRLAPGMYVSVSWPIRRTDASLLVPPTAVKSTTERVFVVRVRNGVAEWVDVRRGVTDGNMVEVFGDLQAGDTVVLRASDEIRPGTPVSDR